MPGCRQMYRSSSMAQPLLKTAVVGCHILCLLHALTMPLSVARRTRHGRQHLNDTTTVKLPYELPSYRKHDSDNIHYYMTYACEREDLHLSCDEDYIILIVRANYGRHSTRPCTATTKKHHTLCSGSFVHPKKVLSQACTGSRSCTIPVISRLFGNPCPKVSKYLEVYFGCVKDETSRNVDS